MVRLFGKKTTNAEPRFFKKMANQDGTYELYEWEDPEAARQWLLGKKVSQPKYYIQVRTEEGSIWGMDMEGLFLTKLLPWQTNLALADHEGEIVGFPNMNNVRLAANGITDNFVVEVQCGDKECESTWMDGVRYQDVTVVRCPKCGAYSKVDSSFIVLVDASV